MKSLSFETDIRNEDPNQSGHRIARFREGWRKAMAGEAFAEDTLKQLTWENLGYRLGTLFGKTDDALIDEMYDWCVRQLENK